jgi:MFS transporter, SP family, solute carrier family 2 (myo-inositol transporter), member 13
MTTGPTVTRYGNVFKAVTGLGGLLYGIDLGIISAALLYVNKTIDLTSAQTSLFVAPVLSGSIISSLVAGLLADWFGRKKMMIVSGLLFIASVVFIVLSRDFTSLFLGRLLQGISVGVIAMVVPLHLAECLPAKSSGRGTASFQLMLTAGVFAAALTGWSYTQQAEVALAAAAGNMGLSRIAEDHAWRGMFLSIIFPGLIFFVGAFFLTETPRWLFRQGRSADALAVLRRLLPPEEADLEIREMEPLAIEDMENVQKTRGPLLQRKYVIPFVIVYSILAFNQTTGIYSILRFLVIILRQAGMSTRHATQGDVVVKILCCAMTVIALPLVDKKGRQFLLKIGTGGIVLSLIAAGLLFHSFESRRIDVQQEIQEYLKRNTLTLAIKELTPSPAVSGGSMALSALYSYSAGDKAATVLTTDKAATLQSVPEVKESTSPLRIDYHLQL